ncbi:MAG: serine/threonine protein kinase [Sandaracinaceae bacterium]|nr:serine/threonine protein kinase [Sandaracinaceae bacterium]
MVADARERDDLLLEEPDRDDSGLTGTVVGGRYRILRELARGGLGRVYEARHVELERVVAVKVLLEEVARNAEAIKRFQREAQTASQIGHPNIVDVHDFGRTEQGYPYLAMEMLDGRDLDGLLEEERTLTPERTVAILAPVASALDAVHQRGIVHRDIKPGNIFIARRVDGSEQVKLLDFGLAAFSERSDRLTQVGTIVGTPHYMAPESAEGALCGPPGDVYALGVRRVRVPVRRAPVRRRAAHRRAREEDLSRGAQHDAAHRRDLSRRRRARPRASAGARAREAARDGG